jgi:hypothetical protein
MLEIDWEDIARFLFDLLDDIDTASDIAKSDDKLYREYVEKLHRRRFEVADTDGYEVIFKDRVNEQESILNTTKTIFFRG